MSRVILALKAFWKILVSREMAAAWETFVTQRLAAADAETAPEPEAAAGLTGEDAGAVYALALLQRHGRLVDFLQENIDDYDDAQVGAAVRQIHGGCRQVLDEHFRLQPVREENEGDRVTVESGFDPSAIRLTGSVSGEPPFQGTLQHKGWRAAAVQLPERNAELDTAVVQPAEVEAQG